MAEITEFRWHGRAGQGLITAVELLAQAALEEGLYFQAFPEFGAERTGAPMRAYSRFSRQPITLHCPVAEPHGVIILDSSLLKSENVFAGLLPGGFALVNTSRTPETLRQQTKLSGYRLYTVPASRIAREVIGRDMPNIPAIGALLQVIGLVNKDTMIRLVRARMSTRLAPKVVEANIQALEQASRELAGEKTAPTPALERR